MTTTKDPSRSKAPFILGGCGCMSVLIGLILLVLAYKAKDSVIGSIDLGKPKADLAHYTNTREGRSGNLAESYVDFSFDYPKSWTLKPPDPDQVNFVTVEKNVDGKTWENLNVGYFKTAGSKVANEQLYSQLLSSIGEQFSQQFPNLQKVHEGATKAGDYDAYEALWSTSVEAEGKPVAVYIRAILLPTPDGTKGVTLLMMGTSFNPDLKKAEDLGTTGELADVVKSFKF